MNRIITLTLASLFHLSATSNAKEKNGQNRASLMRSSMLKTIYALSVLFFCSISFCPSVSYAGTNSYFCVVTKELHLADDGTLVAYPNPLALGEKFAVDRSTGERVENSPWWGTNGEKISVLSTGNTSNSFVAVYVAPAGGGGVFLTTLRIEEFIKTKPFLLTSNGSIYTGTCE